MFTLEELETIDEAMSDALYEISDPHYRKDACAVPPYSDDPEIQEVAKMYEVLQEKISKLIVEQRTQALESKKDSQ